MRGTRFEGRLARLTGAFVAGTLAVVATAVPAHATVWNGEITSFTASPSTVTASAGSDYSMVTVTISPGLPSGYKLSVYDQNGARKCLNYATNATSCSFPARPAINTTMKYYAYVALDAPSSAFPSSDVRATEGPLKVKNVGWSGSFSSFSATRSVVTATAGQDYAIVSAQVTPEVAGGYKVSIYDENNVLMCVSTATPDDGCSFTSRPAVNTTKTYTAYVAMDAPTNSLPTSYVKLTQGPVTVTNVGWVGTISSFTASRSEVTVNDGNDWATVAVSLSTPLAANYKVSVYDENHIRQCYSTATNATGCSFTARPGVMETKSYTAYVALDAPATALPSNSIRTTAGAVVVQNVGWVGTITEFEAEDEIVSGVNGGTVVHVTVSDPLAGGYIVSVYDEDDILQCRSLSFTDTGCSFVAHPEINSTKSYTAYVARSAPSEAVPGYDVRATSEPIYVVNSAWAGTFTTEELIVDDPTVEGANSLVFEWDQPLEFVDVVIVDSQGNVVETCSDDGLTSCTAVRALGPGESDVLRAEARVQYPSGGYRVLAASDSLEAVGMSANGFADFVIEAAPALLTKALPAERAAIAATSRVGMVGEAFCMILGVLVPSNRKYQSSVPDITLDCNFNKKFALAGLIILVGTTIALTIWYQAATADPDDEVIHNDGAPGTQTDPAPDATSQPRQPSEPDPTPSPAPAPPGGGGGAANPPYGTATCAFPPPSSEEDKLYRGVSESHHAYDAALQGDAWPGDVLGSADPLLHNEGITDSSRLTSWTTDYNTAVQFATESGSECGVILEIDASDVADRIVESPDAYNESEVLVAGVVFGARVIVGGPV